jgi:hypothetical protein
MSGHYGNLLNLKHAMEAFVGFSMCRSGIPPFGCPLCTVCMYMYLDSLQPTPNVTHGYPIIRSSFFLERPAGKKVLDYLMAETIYHHTV